MSEPTGLGRAEVRRLLELHDLSPRKSLGQHFVVDPNTVERIARLSGAGPGDHVVEIGPGLGSLTLALAATGAAVTAVEIDGRLADVLRSVVPGSVRILEADALRLEWDGELDPALCWLLVANLPYNVATPLVITLLESVPQITKMLVMVQREVGVRLAARPGGKEYGAASVRVAYFASARVVGEVSAEVFHPRPNVASALVELVRRDLPAVDRDEASYEEIGRLVRAGFAGRRKMLRRSLAGLVDPVAFELAAVEPTLRAEQLDVVAWGKLARCQRSIESKRSPS